MPTKPIDQKYRVQKNVAIDASGCWNWLRTKDRLGYGRLKVQLGSRVNFRTTSAHRYAYELWTGPIPKRMCVLHSCDNRGCCNPEHLFLGTQRDNMRDMHAKGRGPSGYKRDPAICAANAKRAAIDAAPSANAGEQYE